VVLPERLRVRLFSSAIGPLLTKPLLSPILSSSSPKLDPRVPENLLSLLERLESFPVAQTDLKSWWVEELQTKPARPKKGAQAVSKPDDPETDNESDTAAEDDWRKFFDEADSQKQKKPSEPSIRLHEMTVHQSLHSLASHRAVFTRLWLRLLPRLSDDGREGSALSLRALNIMHHGVMPHLTRAVMVMDWVGGCVDHGMVWIVIRCHL
jgi:U3 small nucleolar RNA-associated protein 19